MDEKVPNLENEKEDLNYNIFQKSKSIFIKFNNDKKIKLRTIDISKIFNLYEIKEKEIINYILFPKYKKINILDEILSLKEQGNLKIKENIDEAIKKYDEAIKIIYDYEDSEKKDSNKINIIK